MIFGNTLKLVALVASPVAVVTVIGPVVAPAVTVAVTWVSVTVTTIPGTPLKATAVVSARLVPLSATVQTSVPLAGVKLVCFGIPVKAAALAAEPIDVVTVIG